MKPTLKKFFFFLILFSLLLPVLTRAITFGPPFELPTFEELINTIISFISWVAIAIVPVAIIVAAFYFLTSGGDPEKVRIAKRIIFFTIIGLIIILLARGLPSLIKQILVGPSGPPPPPPPPAVEICDNNIDDDGDTLMDCYDPDCFGDPACSCPPNICNDLRELVSSLLFLRCGESGYDPIADVNKDKRIGVADLIEVGLICGDAAACQAIWDNTFDPCVSPNLPPVADARVGSALNPTGSSVNVTEGATVYFDGSTYSKDPDGTITKYEWDFKDDGVYDWSSTTTGKTTYDKYSAGSYTARLRVTDDDRATATDTVSITVNPAPALIASITSPSDGQIFLQGTSITFSGSTSGGVSPYTYSWNSNIDGIIGNTLTFTKDNLSVGVHTITFKVTDSAPTPVTASDSITITITNDTTPPTIQNAKVNPTSGPSGTIFIITADILDPLGVDPTKTKAHIQNPDETDVAQVTLYDDGMHNDGAANDGTYGASWNSTGFPVGPYYVDITACDLIGNCGEAENI